MNPDFIVEKRGEGGGAEWESEEDRQRVGQGRTEEDRTE